MMDCDAAAKGSQPSSIRNAVPPALTKLNIAVFSLADSGVIPLVSELAGVNISRSMPDRNCDVNVGVVAKVEPGKYFARAARDCSAYGLEATLPAVERVESNVPMTKA